MAADVALAFQAGFDSLGLFDAGVGVEDDPPPLPPPQEHPHLEGLPENE